MSDKIKPIQEKVFFYRGYCCAVLFQPTGHRCGYIRIPADSKFYNVLYDEINLPVHGGLTYSRDYLSTVEYTDVVDSCWWIGWDYAHCCDVDDIDSLIKYYKDDKRMENVITNRYETRMFNYGKVYSLDDVISECEEAVNKLIILEEENDSTRASDVSGKIGE